MTLQGPRKPKVHCDIGGLMSSVVHCDTLEPKDTIVTLQGFVESRGHCDVLEPH